MTTATRRAFAAAAAAAGATALSGCSAALTALAGQGRSTLHVFLVGFPIDAADRLTHALRQCGQLYGQQPGALRPQLAIDSLVIPPSAWFDAGSTNPLVQGPAVAATTMAGTPSQVIAPGGPLVINGRTALDVMFGADPLPTPRLRAGTRTWPDLVISYDAWQYWLAIMATPQSHVWKQAGAWNAGIPPEVADHGRWWTPDGTLFAAWPLLRSPMGLWASRPDWRPAVPWTWSSLAAEVQKQGSGDDTSGFAVSLAFPAQTEAAMAMICSAGGALGRAGPDGVSPPPPNAAATTAAQRWAGLAAPRRVPYGTNPNLQVQLWPDYIWSAFWGPASGGPPPPFWPLPAGAARRGVPATYVCAVVPRGAANPQLAGEFASFLWGRPAQQILGGLQVGLELRPADARLRMARLYPFVHASDVVADPTADMTLYDLFGAWKTAATASAVDAAVDAFAQRMTSLESPGA